MTSSSYTSTPAHSSSSSPFQFDLTDLEAYTLKALPLTLFSFDSEWDEITSVLRESLKTRLIDRGYQIAPKPHSLSLRGNKAKYGIQICQNNEQTKQIQLPSGWKATSFNQAVNFISYCEFQAAILYWQGEVNDGHLPIAKRDFGRLTDNQRGISIAYHALGPTSILLRKHLSEMFSTSGADVYMLSPDIRQIINPENRILAYILDRFDLATSQAITNEDAVSPLNLGTPNRPEDDDWTSPQYGDSPIHIDSTSPSCTHEEAYTNGGGSADWGTESDEGYESSWSDYDGEWEADDEVSSNDGGADSPWDDAEDESNSQGEENESEGEHWDEDDPYSSKEPKPTVVTPDPPKTPSLPTITPNRDESGPPRKRKRIRSPSPGVD